MHNPPHPGSILKNDVLPELGINVKEAASQIGISREAFSRLINGKADISIDMALRLEAWLIEPSAESWVRMQAEYDLWQARQSQLLNIQLIKPVKRQVKIKSELNNLPDEDRKNTEVNRPDNRRKTRPLQNTIAKRLKEGRVLCKFTVPVAANQLDITPEELAKFELNLGIERDVLLHLIHRASMVYNVSIDWLFGVTDDYELDIKVRTERCTMSYLQNIHFEQHGITLNELRKQHNRLVELETTVALLPIAVQKIHDTLKRFIELNRRFIDMPVGSTLVRAVEDAATAAHQANCKMVRHKCLLLDALYPRPKPLM